MEQKTGNVQTDIELLSRQIEGSVGQMKREAEQISEQWDEEQTRITLAFRTVNQKILQSMVHLDNSSVDDLRKPELVYQGLIVELMNVVHRWRLLSAEKGDVHDKMSRSLLNCLIKCCKSVGSPVEKLENVGEKFDAGRMILAGTVSVDDPEKDGVVCASLIPGIRLRDLLLSRELVLCGAYEKPEEPAGEEPIQEAEKTETTGAGEEAADGCEPVSK